MYINNYRNDQIIIGMGLVHCTSLAEAHCLTYEISYPFHSAFFAMQFNLVRGSILYFVFSYIENRLQRIKILTNSSDCQNCCPIYKKVQAGTKY
jgi:hypothetical protein